MNIITATKFIMNLYLVQCRRTIRQLFGGRGRLERSSGRAEIIIIRVADVNGGLLAFRTALVRIGIHCLVEDFIVPGSVLGP